jgi:carboxyl-terminal processing protease
MKILRQKLTNKVGLIVLSLILVFTFAASAQDDGVEGKLPQESQQQGNYTKADAFQDVMFLLQNYYVEDVEFETLI